MKAVIFDCFGVLTTDYWREFVGQLPVALQQAASDINRAYDSGYIEPADFIKQVTALTGKRPDMVEHTNGAATKNNDLLAYISDLKGSYKIGLLSNIATNWITESFLTIREQQLFDAMIFSHEVNLIKPDVRIFELMAERLGVRPEDCIMIDDIEANCSGAQATGMQAILYTDFQQTKQALNALLADTKD